jgi:DMSO/TMAO reductase YedYZ molybdopterin-dependent catalytic subunit
MSSQITRRRLLKNGLGVVAGAATLGAAAGTANHYGLIPANCRGVYGLSETLTYAGQRLLTTALPSMAREFDASHISTVTPVNGKAPTSEAYTQMAANSFADWRLDVDGLVDRPMSFSLSDLRNLPARTQITHQACEEGWSFIAQWTGAPLSTVLERVGMRPNAKFVFYFSIDDWWDSIDMNEALHPQTLLAYEMNGQDLPLDHGAPARMKVPRQLGYKNMKFLTKLTVTDTAADIGDGLGSIAPGFGYAWFAGI